MTDLERALSNSIFQEPWFLDAVAPGQWGEVKVEQGGRVKARLPFLRKRRWGMTILTHPRLSQTMGPWLAPLAGKNGRRLAEEKHLCDALIDQLPDCDFFSQAFHPSVTNHLPWHWRGFSQRTLYTYRIDDLSDLDLVWRNFGDNIRNQVRKAQNLVAVDPAPELEQILAVNDLTFARQGLRAPYSRDYVRAIDSACAPRGASLKLTAVDAAGRVHAGLYLVWDAEAAHGLILAGDPELRQSGAGSLLMWEAIQRAAAVTRSFDFGGSMIESVETFFRNFGTRQIPYHHLTRMSRRFRLLMSARELAQGWAGRP